MYQADTEALAIAAAVNIVPVGFQQHAPLEASAWIRSERPIEGALGDEISEQLKGIGWSFVFHVTVPGSAGMDRTVRHRGWRNG